MNPASRIYLTVCLPLLIAAIFVCFVPLKVGGIICGLSGSIMLVIPPARLELIKLAHHQFRNIRFSSPKLEELKSNTAKTVINHIMEWHPADSALLCVGAILLAMSFFLDMIEYMRHLAA